MSKQLKADLALLFVTVGWGASFILVKDSLETMETFNFLAIRFSLAFVISSLIFIQRIRHINLEGVKYSFILGFALFAHYALQTLGLNYTTASKSAFITGLNVVMVPLLLAILHKKLPDKKLLLSAFLAMVGLGMLTLKQSLAELNLGDLYTFACAVLFSFYIILVSKYTHKVDSISLAVMQIGVVALFSFVTSIALETPMIPKDSGVWTNILILSVVCTSGAFIIQNLAQRFTSPSHTALIFTAEPVFAALFGYFLFNETLGIKGSIGGILILAAMILSELDFKDIIRFKRQRQESFAVGEQNSCGKM